MEIEVFRTPWEVRDYRLFESTENSTNTFKVRPWQVRLDHRGIITSTFLVAFQLEVTSKTSPLSNINNQKIG